MQEKKQVKVKILRPTRHKQLDEEVFFSCITKNLLESGCCPEHIIAGYSLGLIRHLEEVKKHIAGEVTHQERAAAYGYVRRILKALKDTDSSKLGMLYVLALSINDLLQNPTIIEMDEAEPSMSISAPGQSRSVN